MISAATAPAVYIASPLGFDEPGRVWGRDVLLPAVRAAGLVPLDPWDDPDHHLERAMAVDDADQRRAALAAANAAVAGRNADLIRSSAGVLAVLDGTDVDSGTAAEIGFAVALHRPVVGLRTDIRPAGDNEAAIVNLQVEGFIHQSGGAIEADVTAAVHRLAGLLGVSAP